MDHNLKVFLVSVATLIIPGVVYEIVASRRKNYDGPSFYGLLCLVTLTVGILAILFRGVVYFWDYILQ